MPKLALAAFVCLIASPADAFQFTCEDVRAFVAEHGKAKAVTFAVKHGATLRDLNEARKCLSSKQ